MRKPNPYKTYNLFFDMVIISEEEKGLIQQEARIFLKEFSRKLDKINENLIESFENVESRKEGDGWETNPDFKELILENAPYVDDNLIMGEKGAWKK